MDNHVLCVFSLSNKLQYINRNLDISSNILQPNITFELVNQDNIPCTIVEYFLEVRLHNERFFRPHLKKQSFLCFTKPTSNFTVEFQQQFNNIALSQLHGYNTELILTKHNSKIQFFVYNGYEEKQKYKLYPTNVM